MLQLYYIRTASYRLFEPPFPGSWKRNFLLYKKNNTKKQNSGWVHLYTIGGFTEGSSLDCIKVYVPTNPCPCGYYPSKKCRCTDYEIIHYRGKISGPILERIDIQKSVAHVDYFELNEGKGGRTSAQLRKIVEQARKIQQERFKDVTEVKGRS